MFKSGYILDTPEKIAAAIYNKTRVNVWQDGKLLDYGDVIESQTEDSITINGNKYLKAVCQIRIR